MVVGHPMEVGDHAQKHAEVGTRQEVDPATTLNQLIEGSHV